MERPDFDDDLVWSSEEYLAVFFSICQIISWKDYDVIVYLSMLHFLFTLPNRLSIEACLRFLELKLGKDDISFVGWFSWELTKENERHWAQMLKSERNYQLIS